MCGFGCHGYTGLIEWVEEYFLISILRNNLYKIIRIICFLKVFIVRWFLNTGLISWMVIWPYRLYDHLGFLSLWVSFGNSYLSLPFWTWLFCVCFQLLGKRFSLFLHIFFTSALSVVILFYFFYQLSDFIKNQFWLSFSYLVYLYFPFHRFLFMH